MLSFLWKILDLDLTFTLYGIILHPFFIIPGIIAFFLIRNFSKNLFSKIFNIGNFAFYLISFAFNILNFAGTFTLSLIFKILKVQNLANFETLILGLFLDLPLILIVWFPTILLNEFAWRYLLLENFSGKSDLSKIILTSLFWILSYLIIIIYLFESKNLLSAFNFTITLFLSGIILNLFYLKSRSIILCSFHHILFIAFNSHIFSVVFNKEMFYLTSLEFFTLDNHFIAIMQIFLIFPLFWVVNKVKMRK